MPNSTPNQSIHEITAHANEDYPVGVYYVEPDKMYMNYVRWHWHEEMEIDLVKTGTAEITVGDEKIILEEGQAIMINCNVIHTIRSAPGSECVLVSLLFHPNYLFNNEASTLSVGYITPVIQEPDLRYLVFDRKDMWSRSVMSYIRDIFDANFAQEYGYELATKSALCQIWLLFLGKCKKSFIPKHEVKKEPVLPPDEARIKDAILYIQEHYFESITLDDIAASIHVSKSECCRCFKRAVNVTPFEYLMRYRILQAANQILQNDRNATSISELASMVGFNNTSYFNKLFKKYLNCTPTEFRKQSKTEHRDQLSPFGLSLTHI